MTDLHIDTVDPATLTPWLGNQSFAAAQARFDAQGYLVFENVLSAQAVEAVRDALRPHLSHSGRNNFEGFHSQRVYALLAKAPAVFSELVSHPLALAFAEADLGPSCLLSACLAINTDPGETVQPWHRDDGAILLPMPRPSLGVSAFWAIDDTTERNGATEIIPGSHRVAHPLDNDNVVADVRGRSLPAPTAQDPQPAADAKPVPLRAGSLMIAKGTLLHRGGANRSSSSRLIVTPQYCPGWVRQLENMMLAVPAETAATLPRRVRQLLGYSIHGAFMGYVDGTHPERRLPRRQDPVS
jgi:ectoine hydroxylase-related dioxygenase (phytanoyl-CoA dioxygenase family)